MKKLLISLIVLFGPWKAVYAVWDTTTPSGTEAKSLGDDRIREFKTDVQTALQHEGSFPGADTSSPHYIWTPSTGTSAQRPTGSTNAVAGMLYINSSSNTVERYDGSTWSPIASLIPSGSVIPFYQSSCPTGWTRIMTSAVQNVALRSVIDGSGGTSDKTGVDISDPITLRHSHNVNSHTHPVNGTTSSDGAHTHTVTNTTASKVDPGGSGFTIVTSVTSPTGSNGTHSHTINLNTGVASDSGTDSSLTDIAAFNSAEVIMCTAP